MFIFDTLKIFKCSIPPLALLNNNLLLEGNDLSLTIKPSKLKLVAHLIIEPIFLGSETSSNAKKFKFLLYFFCKNSLILISSKFSISATIFWCEISSFPHKLSISFLDL